MSLNPFKDNAKPKLGTPSAPPEAQAFLIHYEICGCENVEILETSNTVKLFEVITDLLNDDITDFYIERVTFMQRGAK
jgi:hypothetical protein